MDAVSNFDARPVIVSAGFCRYELFALFHACPPPHAVSGEKALTNGGKKSPKLSSPATVDFSIDVIATPQLNNA